MINTSVEKRGVGIREVATPLLIGVLTAFVVSLLFLAILSAVMAAKDLPAASVVPLACASIGAGAFFGGFISARAVRSRGFLLGAVTGIAFYVILYLVGAVMRQADLNAMLLIKVLVAVVLGAAGGITGVNFRHKSRH